MRHVIVTGPESAGKTTLSRAIADELGGVWVPEYPRGYLGAAGRLAVRTDFPHFVTVNDQLVAAAGATAARRGPDRRSLVVQDTGAEVLLLWARDKFAGAFPEVEAAFRAQRPSLYLLCRPDLPWEYDPLREDPHRRDVLFRALRQLISTCGHACVEVVGTDGARTARALQAVRRVVGGWPARA